MNSATGPSILFSSRLLVGCFSPLNFDTLTSTLLTIQVKTGLPSKCNLPSSTRFSTWISGWVKNSGACRISTSGSPSCTSLLAK